MNATSSIITMTLNPCIDRTIAIDHFVLNGTNKVKNTREDLSGKGVNVSTALNQLNESTFCMGFDYISGEKQVGKMLSSLNIPHELIQVAGNVRVNIKVFDQSNGEMTEFNEKGQAVSAQNIQQLIDCTRSVLSRMASDSILVLSGSIPQNTPVTIYQTLIQIASEYNIRVLLDASGDMLIEGVKAKPFAIKPNQDEIAQLVGRPVDTIEEAAVAAIECNHMGIAYVCVSLGSKGALLSSSEGVFYAPPADIEVKGIQGAGDSLVAGMCIAFMHGKDTETALRYATAAAGGSVSREGTLMCLKSNFDMLLPTIKIKKLDI